MQEAAQYLVITLSLVVTLLPLLFGWPLWLLPFTALGGLACFAVCCSLCCHLEDFFDDPED